LTNSAARDNLVSDVSKKVRNRVVKRRTFTEVPAGTLAMTDMIELRSRIMNT
jgi:hypothetical protein